MQVPLRTRVKLPHSPQASPSKPFMRASRMRSMRRSTSEPMRRLTETSSET